MAWPRENPENRTEDIDVTIKEWEKNDNDNELKIPKKVLDKIKTKFSKLEWLVIDWTKDELADLKSKIETANATMNTEKLEASLRKEVIEEKIENNEAWFDAMLTWVKETSTEQIINDLWTKIWEQFNSYGLDSKEIDNIKTWITKKIMNSWWVDNALKVIDDYLKWKEKWTQDSTKLQQKDTMIDDLVKNNSVDLKWLLEKNKNNKELLNWLLSNPKAIEEYKEWTDISNIIALQSKELQDYLISWNDKVVWMDKKMWDIRKQASNILNNEKINEYMKKWFIEFIEKILKFLWWTELWKTILEDYNKNKDMTKSVENLKSYWIVKVDWVEKEWKNHKSIKLLDWKDLTNIQTWKLESFFSNCKEKWIDITKNDFWSTVLADGNNKTIKWTVKEKEQVQVQAEQETGNSSNDPTQKQNPWYSTKKGQFQNPQQSQQEVDVVKTYNIGEIETEDIDTPDFTNFYKKLNNIGFITEVSWVPKTEANPSSTPTQQQEQPKSEQEQKKEQEKKIMENITNTLNPDEKTIVATVWENWNEKAVYLTKKNWESWWMFLSLNNDENNSPISSLSDIENRLTELGLNTEETWDVMNQIKTNFNPATLTEAATKREELEKKEKEKNKYNEIMEKVNKGEEIKIAEIWTEKKGSLYLKKLGKEIILELKTPSQLYWVGFEAFEWDDTKTLTITWINSINDIKNKIKNWNEIKGKSIEYVDEIVQNIK